MALTTARTIEFFFLIITIITINHQIAHLPALFLYRLFRHSRLYAGLVAKTESIGPASLFWRLISSGASLFQDRVLLVRWVGWFCALGWLYRSVQLG